MERGFDNMVQQQMNTQQKEKKVKHQGVLAYTSSREKGQEKEHFYDDALNKAFYEMYVLA